MADAQVEIDSITGAVVPRLDNGNESRGAQLRQALTDGGGEGDEGGEKQVQDGGEGGEGGEKQVQDGGEGGEKQVQDGGEGGEKQVQDGGEGGEKQAAIDPPTHWSGEDQDNFRSLEPKAQKFLLDAYKGMEAGHTQRSQRAAPMLGVLAKWEGQVQGAPEQIVDQALQLHATLTNGTLTQKQDIIRGLARDYEVSFRQKPAETYDPKEDPFGIQKQIQDALAPIAGRLKTMDEGTALQRQNAEAAATEQGAQALIEFGNRMTDDGKPAHPYFNEVQGDMLALAMAKRAQGARVGPELLPELYKQACRMNDQVHEKLQAAERAKSASDEQGRQAKARQAQGSIVGTAAGGAKVQPTDRRTQIREALLATTLNTQLNNRLEVSLMPPNVGEAVATTLRHRSKTIADNISHNNALLTRLKSRGKIKTFPGGRSINEPLMYAENSTYTRYSGAGLLDTTPGEILDMATYPIRQSSVQIIMTGLEEIQNTGMEALIDLLDAKMEGAERTFANMLSEDLYSDGTEDGGNQVDGLQLAISNTPTTGTVGGINRASQSWWQNVYRSKDLTKDNILEEMIATWVAIQRGKDGPDLVVADNHLWTMLWNELAEKQRFTAVSSDMAKAGWSGLGFNGADVILDGGVGGNIPARTMFFLNTNYIRFRPHKDRNIVPLDKGRHSPNQDVMVQILAWAGNLCMSNAQLQARLYDTAA